MGMKVKWRSGKKFPKNLATDFRFRVEVSRANDHQLKTPEEVLPPFEVPPEAK
jgi:hypothetical protein